MTIAKGASVLVKRQGVERPGTVIREVSPHVVQGLTPGDTETTKQYEVEMPEHNGLPPHTDRFFDYELTAIPHDFRAR